MNISHVSTLSVVASSSLSFVVMLLSLSLIKQVICQLLAKVFAQSTLVTQSVCFFHYEN